MPSDITVEISMPMWLKDMIENPETTTRNGMESVAGILKQVEHEGNIEVVRILRSNGVRQGMSKKGTGLYDAFGGYQSNPRHSIVNLGLTSKDTSNIKKYNSGYEMRFGVGNMDIIDNLLTEDGSYNYCEILDKGSKSYTINPVEKSALKYPVNEAVLSGYNTLSNGGAHKTPYIERFRKYWATSREDSQSYNKAKYPGDWEGNGFFNYATHWAKPGIGFIDKTFEYIATLINDLSQSMCDGIINNGLKVNKRGQVMVYGYISGAGWGRRGWLIKEKWGL